MSFFNLFRRTEQSPERPKPDLDSTFFNMKVKQLPVNFAQSLMELQMKLEFAETFQIEAVQQLNDLYRLAIEFYVHEDTKKASHFQRKLTSLLSNPQTLSLFDQAKQKPKQQHYQYALRNQMGQFNAQSTTLVAQMIEGSNRKIEQRQRMMDQQFHDQETRLRSRMECRSTSRQTRSKRAFLSP